MKENNENKEEKHGVDKWQWRKVGGSFHHFWTIRLRIIKKRDRIEKMKENRGENERRGKNEKRENGKMRR